MKIFETDLVLPFEKLRAWLYRSAIRVYIDKYRRDKRYHDILMQEFFRKEEFVKYDQKDYAPLYEAVADLSPKYQTVLDLYYFQDLSIKEIAGILGISQDLVKVNLYRARKRLALILEEKGYHYEDF